MTPEYKVIYNASKISLFRWELWSKFEQTSIVGELSGMPSITTKVVTKKVDSYYSSEKANEMKVYYETLDKFKGE